MPPYTVYDTLERNRGKSAFAVHVEFDEVALQSNLKKLINFNNKFAKAAERVVAAFGAYMPYSAALEFGYTHYRSNLWHKARPHIVPAIRENQALILQQVAEGYRVILLKSIGTGAAVRSLNSASEIQTEMEKVWEIVLNGKVRMDAISNAESKGILATGMHISTISGWGKAPTADWIKSRQKELMTERNMMRKAMRTSKKEARAMKNALMRTTKRVGSRMKEF